MGLQTMVYVVEIADRPAGAGGIGRRVRAGDRNADVP